MGLAELLAAGQIEPPALAASHCTTPHPSCSLQLLPHAEPIQGPPLVHKGELLLTAPQATWEGWLREFGLYDSQHSVGRMAAIIAVGCTVRCAGRVCGFQDC